MKFFEQFWLIWGKDSICIYHKKLCVYCVWCSCLRVVHFSCHEGQWPPVWVWTYLMVREETECLCCFFNCVSIPRSDYVHTGFPICTSFCEINSECLQILCSYSLLPHTCHYSKHTLISCANRVIEHTNLTFLGSQIKWEIWLYFCWACQHCGCGCCTDTTAGHDKSFTNEHSLVEHQRNL
jgi:hypothetical protein